MPPERTAAPHRAAVLLFAGTRGGAYSFSCTQANRTRTHQMTLGGKDDEFMREDILRAGASVDVPKDGAEIIEEVDAALDMWDREVREAGVPRDWQRTIGKSFRRFGRGGLLHDNRSR